MSDKSPNSEQVQQADVPIMGKEWEKQQIKSFTAWMNLHGKKHSLVISDISQDLRDGKKLLRFLEIISGESTPRPEKGNLRVHQINNVRHALDFISKKGIKLAGTGAEEIVDGNLKMTLGMIWVIILRFAINIINEGSSSAAEGLLLWVKKKTEGYKHVNVTNFTTSFMDGMVFNALIHKHRPDLLDYSQLKPENDATNLNQSFELAEKHIDIPRMLDVEDMITSPDPKSVMTYVACFYHAFSKNQVVENAIRRIQRVMDNNAENAKRIQEYERIATELLKWIKEKCDDFKNCNPENQELQELLAKIDSINVYRKDEKPPKAKEKAQLESLINTIKTRMHLQKRGDFVPLEGHGINDIQTAWKELEKYERSLLDRLYLTVQHLYYVDHLLKKFMYKCDQQDNWMSGRKEQLNTDVSTLLMTDVVIQKNKLIELGSEMDARDSRLQTVTALQQKLRELNCKEMNKVDERHNKIVNEWKEFHDAKESFSKKLNEREALLMKIEKMKQEYAQKAPELKTFLDEALEDLHDSYQVQSVNEINQLLEELKKFADGVNKKEEVLKQVLSLEEQILNSEDKVNAYCSISGRELNDKFNTVKDALEERKKILESEHTKQVSNEKNKKDFADMAEAIDAFRNKCLSEVHQSSDAGSKLEDHVAALKKINDKADSYYKEKYPLLSDLHVLLQSAQIFHNPFTIHTLESISQDYQHLMDSISTNVNEVENQIIVRDGSNITEQQVKDYRKSYDYFDKNKLNYLNPDEFRAFLISNEFSVNPDEVNGEAEFKRIMSKVDDENTGRITFNAFLNFLVTESKDTDTSEQIIESFKILAGGKDYIMPETIKKELPDRAETLIKSMSPSKVEGAPEGALDYRSFAATLYGETEL